MAGAFLARYPFYAEAYKFRARMLLVKGRNREALRSLKAAKGIDEWKVYGFDEAEANYNAGAVDEAVRVLMAQIESLLDAIQSGTHIFLLGTMVSRAAQEKIEREVRKEVMRVVSGRSRRLARHRTATLLKRARRSSR